MAKYDCEICSGSGYIRLPLYRRATAVSFEAMPPEIEETSRQYPCPECTPVVRLERVQAIKVEGFTSSQIEDPAFIEHVRYGLAREVAAFLLKEGYIKFERGQIDTIQMRFATRATLGVVRPNAVDNLEQRIAERQSELAHEVVEEVERQINNWGSHYGHSEILKRDATWLAREAIGIVVKKHADFKPL